MYGRISEDLGNNNSGAVWAFMIYFLMFQHVEKIKIDGSLQKVGSLCGVSLAVLIYFKNKMRVRELEYTSKSLIIMGVLTVACFPFPTCAYY